MKVQDPRMENVLSDVVGEKNRIPGEKTIPCRMQLFFSITPLGELGDFATSCNARSEE
jgi:hypothetical protein